ncbi:SDR family NAD(P)-dependent oxidoreductase [Streptomyces nigra]|uniref:SDR family NAD(P)-dependent oxidoreductase n=1 Tax=Streptomyces nigra TaxID=1827580 RepID=UPI0036AA122C
MSRTWSAGRSNRRATHRTARRGGRSSAKTKAVADELGAHCFVADFAHLHQVHTLAAQLADHCPRIHVLVNNAGAILGDRHVTADGFEETFQVNYLAPFLLTNLLLELRNVVARLTTTAPTAGGNGRSLRSGSTGRPPPLVCCGRRWSYGAEAPLGRSPEGPDAGSTQRRGVHDQVPLAAVDLLRSVVVSGLPLPAFGKHERGKGKEADGL